MAQAKDSALHPAMRRSAMSVHTCTKTFQSPERAKLKKVIFGDSSGTRIANLRGEPVGFGVQMRHLSKTEFNDAIEANSDAHAEAHPLATVRSRPKRASRIIITVLVIVVGIGAGWLSGRVLNNHMNHSPAAGPPGDASAGDSSTALSPPSSDSQPPSKRTSEVSAPASQQPPEAEQPVAASEQRPTEPEPKAAPPKTPKVDKDAKVDKDDGPETPTAEDPAKEIGRQAFKKMSKEVKRMKRELANKNENQDQR